MVLTLKLYYATIIYSFDGQITQQIHGKGTNMTVCFRINAADVTNFMTGKRVNMVGSNESGPSIQISAEITEVEFNSEKPQFAFDIGLTHYVRLLAKK